MRVMIYVDIWNDRWAVMEAHRNSLWLTGDGGTVHSNECVWIIPGTLRYEDFIPPSPREQYLQSCIGQIDESGCAFRGY